MMYFSSRRAAADLFLRRCCSALRCALAGINEHRMRAMGYGVFGQLAAFTVAGALAGLAGYLWGRQWLHQP
jgi:branched-chain amino acid transport system permease protein